MWCHSAFLQALQAAGLEKHADPEGHGALDKTRVGVLVGSGMGGLSGEGDAGQTSMLHTQLCQWQPVVHWLLDTAGAAVIANVGSVPLPGNSCCCAVFQDGVKALVEKGHKKITPFFIPYAITNMGASSLMLIHFDLARQARRGNACLLERHELRPGGAGHTNTGLGTPHLLEAVTLPLG